MKKEILQAKIEAFKQIFPEHFVSDESGSLVAHVVRRVKYVISTRALMTLTKNTLHKYGEMYYYPEEYRVTFLLTKTGVLKIGSNKSKRFIWKNASLVNISQEISMGFSMIDSRYHTSSYNTFLNNRNEFRQQIADGRVSRDEAKVREVSYICRHFDSSTPLKSRENVRDQLIKEVSEMFLLGKKYAWILPYEGMHRFKFFQTFSSLQDLKESLNMSGLSDDSFITTFNLKDDTSKQKTKLTHKLNKIYEEMLNRPPEYIIAALVALKFKGSKVDDIPSSNVLLPF